MKKSLLSKIKYSVLFKNTFIYTFVQLINKGIPLLLLPVLTRYLSANDYGMIANYNTFLMIVGIFIGLSVTGAVSVNYFHMQQQELCNYIGNIFNILIISMIVTVFCVMLFQDLITKHIVIPNVWVYIAITVAVMQNITAINLMLWRNQQKAKPYAIYELSETVLKTAVSLLLVVAVQYGWRGMITGTATAEVVFGLLSTLFLHRRDYLRLNYSVPYIKDALRFGIPLIPHQIALWMRSGVDIILITSIVGVADAGIYSIGYQLGGVVSILAFSFNNAYSPYLFEKLANITEENKLKIVKFTYLYFFGIIIVAIGLNAVFSIILPFLLAKQFQETGKYIFWIAIANAFQGMYLMVGSYIFYAKKTHLLSIVTVSSSILHVSLSFILINLFGAIGAAYATVISFLFTFLFTWRLSSKVYDLPWFSKNVLT